MLGLDYSLNESEGYNYAIAAEGFTNEDIHFLASARQYAKDRMSRRIQIQKPSVGIDSQCQLYL